MIVENLNKINASFAYNLVDLLDLPANIKDANSRKYTYSNKLNLQIYGVTIDKYIGKTVQDFHPTMKKFWGEKYADYVDELDNKLVIDKKPLVDITRTISDADGRIRVQKMVKIPILNNSDVLAILSFCHNLKLELRELYNQYKLFQPKKLAIVKFLDHLNIRSYFIELPTDAELNVLIESVKYTRNKEVSTKLFLSQKTVEYHLMSLKHKVLKEDLLTLLSILRNFDIG